MKNVTSVDFIYPFLLKQLYLCLKCKLMLPSLQSISMGGAYRSRSRWKLLEQSAYHETNFDCSFFLIAVDSSNSLRLFLPNSILWLCTIRKYSFSNAFYGLSIYISCFLYILAIYLKHKCSGQSSCMYIGWKAFLVRYIANIARIANAVQVTIWL